MISSDDPLENPFIFFEAEMLRNASDAQRNEWAKLTDAQWDTLQHEYSKRRIAEHGGKRAWIKQRNREKQQRAERLAGITASHSAYVNPRSLDVEPEHKRMAEAGRRGGWSRQRRVAGSRMCMLIDS